METRANFILIGAITLAGIIAALGFFVWMAKLQVNQQFEYYNVLFENVSGLTVAGDVSFNGVSVGQVTEIELYDKDPTKVRVMIQVRALTPITTETTAQLRAQGVTGLSFVALSGGSPTAPLLRETSTDAVPIIPSQLSTVQSLAEDAPTLLREAIKTIHDMQGLVSPDNQRYVTNILSNVDGATAGLQTALKDFSSVTGSVSTATGEIGQFTGRLDDISAALKTTLAHANTTLQSADGAFSQVQSTLANADAPISSAGALFDTTNTMMQQQMPGIVSSLASAASTLDATVAEIRAEAKTITNALGDTSELAGDRLKQLEITIASLNATLGDAQNTLRTVEAAAGSVQTLVDGDGTALVSDARGTLGKANLAIDGLNGVIANDVPVIVGDVKTTVATLNRVMDQAGNDLTTFTGDLAPLVATADKTLATASVTFNDASTALNRLEASMDTMDSTLIAAQGTFTTANTVMKEDVAPIMGDVRSSAAQLETTMAAVSQDVPAITAELKQTLARATAMMETIDGVVAASGPPIAQFAQTGLPQFTRFTQEARDLIASLERLTARIERDPARFFLGGKPPEFSR